MDDKKPWRSIIETARKLRADQTSAEGLLWSLLRTRQLCGLKFRRQHPIEPYIVDFACESHRLVVELDGGCHRDKEEKDAERQQFLENLGWTVLRFTNEYILEDAELALIAITRHLGLEFEFRPRRRIHSGMLNHNAPPHNQRHHTKRRH